jgi:phage-related protein
METFDFPYFTWTTRYPESSTKVRFGRGYEFASKPKGPDQVSYILHFKTMKFFTNSAGTVVTTTLPKINIAKLEAFYNAHKMYEKFLLNIPGKGTLTVRFSKPLEYKVAENGQGTVEPFTLEVLTQP